MSESLVGVAEQVFSDLHGQLLGVLHDAGHFDRPPEVGVVHAQAGHEAVDIVFRQRGGVVEADPASGGGSPPLHALADQLKVERVLACRLPDHRQG